MDNSERDTHFKGFARLSRQEITKVTDFFPTTEDQLRAIQTGVSYDHREMLERLDTLLAQCAYDLVCHLLKNSNPLYLDMGGFYDKPANEDIYQNITQLPDITTWPTPQELTQQAEWEAMWWEEKTLATDLSEIDVGEQYDERD